MQGVPQWVKGTTSRQAHVGLPDGTVEEEHGRLGFTGSASHLYRLHAPTSWRVVDGPARHRCFDLTRAEGIAGRWPQLVLGNDDCSLGWWRLPTPAADDDPYLRDADGDLCLFVHAGSGVLATEYGPLAFRSGHYLVVPRGTTFRIEGDGSSPVELFVVEATTGPFRLPDRGMLGRHALFDPAIIDVPDPQPIDETGEFTVVVKRGGVDTTVVYEHHPFDVVGWKGDLAPMRLHTDDIRPVVSPRFHLPPSAHSTFEAPGFIISTFAPRPMESDPEALRLPFFHRNVDYDEVIFYHRGEFFSRAGLDVGMVTFHPSGLHHGPQPAAVERDRAAAAHRRADDPPRIADELAVMVDARRPLHAPDSIAGCEVEDYVASWTPAD